MPAATSNQQRSCGSPPAATKPQRQKSGRSRLPPASVDRVRRSTGSREPRVDGGPAVTLAPQDGAEVVLDLGGDDLVGGSIERGDAGQLHPGNLALN